MNIAIAFYPSVSNKTYDLFDKDLNIKYHELIKSSSDDYAWKNRYNSFFDFQHDGRGLILSFNYGDIVFKSGYITENFLEERFDGLRFTSRGMSFPPFDPKDAFHAKILGAYLSHKFQCYVETKAYSDYFHYDGNAFYCGINQNFGIIPQDCLDPNFDTSRNYIRKKFLILKHLWDIKHIFF